MGEKNIKSYVVVVIAALIMIGFGFLPPFGQITVQGMRILGIFLGMIFAWCFGEIIWASFLALIMASICGFGVINSNYTSAFGNASIGTMIAVMIFCYAVQQCGLLTEVARWITSMKIVQKTPYSLLVGFYAASIILSMLVSNCIPVIFILWALFYEIADQIGIKPYSSFAGVMLCGVAVISNMACAAMPYCAMVILEQNIARASETTFTFNTILYLIVFILICLSMLLFVLVFRFVCRLKFDFEIPARNTYKMSISTEMKYVLGTFSVMLFFLVVPNIMPQTSFMYQLFVGKLGAMGIFLIGVVVLAIVKVNGKPVLNATKALADGVSWELMILMGSAVCVSGYLTADGMGILPTVVALLDPIVAGKSATTIIIIFAVISLIMTNVINDVVTASIMIPLAMSFVMSAGGSTQLLMIVTVAATMQGCLMASGAVVGAMMHGNTQWLRAKDVFKWVAIMEVIVCAILIAVVCVGSLLGI